MCVSNRQISVSRASAKQAYRGHGTHCVSPICKYLRQCERPPDQNIPDMERVTSVRCAAGSSQVRASTRSVYFGHLRVTSVKMGSSQAMPVQFPGPDVVASRRLSQPIYQHNPDHKLTMAFRTQSAPHHFTTAADPRNPRQQ